MLLYLKHLFRPLRISCCPFELHSVKESMQADIGKSKGKLPRSVHIPHEPASPHTRNASDFHPKGMERGVQSSGVRDSPTLGTP